MRKLLFALLLIPSILFAETTTTVTIYVDGVEFTQVELIGLEPGNHDIRPIVKCVTTTTTEESITGNVITITVPTENP